MKATDWNGYCYCQMFGHFAHHAVGGGGVDVVHAMMAVTASGVCVTMVVVGTGSFVVMDDSYVVIA